MHRAFRVARASALLLGLWAAAFSGAAGCGLPIGDIDRTQPNKVQKSIFEGEWYFSQTVVAAPYTAGFTFIGETTERTERVRWDIQESFLIAYRAYDLVNNTDRASALPGDHTENVPIAIFGIINHFDIQRDYNPTTGEQTNVLIENDFDRPWYDRDYIRVDWSQNLAANFNFLVEEVSQVPGSHFVQNPADPDSLLFGVKTSDGAQGPTWVDYQGDSVADLASADYFDVVHRIFASPETIFFEDWDGSVYEEPACWYYTVSDCAPAEVTIRSSFLKATPYEGDAYLPKAYPDNDIVRDEDGEPVRVNFTGEDLQSVAPDPDGFIARVPYFDKFGYFRTERERYDRRFGETWSGRIWLINRFDIWMDAANCYDETAAQPYANCEVKPIIYYVSRGFPRDIKDTAQTIADDYNLVFKEIVRELKYGDGRPLDEVEDVFILRDNTFEADEDGNVVNRGQRFGDLRYNLFAWVDHANLAGLLGYGPAAVDPLNGKIIQASAYTYGAGVDLYAQNGKNIIDLINNPDLLNDYIDGIDVQRDVVGRARQDLFPRQKTTQFVRNMVNTPRNRAIRQQGLEPLRKDSSWLRSRLKALEGTPLEEKLMTDDVVRAMGREPVGPNGVAGAAPSEAALRRSKPSSWMMGRQREREKMREQKLRRRNIMHTRAFDTSVLGLADTLKDLPPEDVFQTIRRAVYRSTTLHEVGHNLGLRHNYEGSTDALNYHREYWDLKGEGAQALELPDAAQLGAGIREYQYSSIMDYAARFSADLKGLGLYDRAALAFGYGDLVEVFENGEPNETLLEIYPLDDVLRNWRHYTKLPQIFGGIDGMYDRRWAPFSEIIKQISGETDAPLWEVPYRFCSDEYDGFNATCASFDEGADAYEITENARRQYLQYFPLSTFQRDRRFFDEYAYMYNIQSYTWWPMLIQYQNWVFDSYFYDFDWQDFRDNYDIAYYGIEDVPWAEADDGGLPGAAASRLLLDTIAEVIAMPEPGSYFFDNSEGIMLWYSPDDEPDAEATIAFPTGRFTVSAWDGDAGYTFYDRLLMIGTFYDKLTALEAAVNSEAAFLGVDGAAQLNQFAIGLSLMFPEEIYRLVGGSATADYPAFSGAYCPDGQYYAPTLTSTETPCPPADVQYLDPGTSFTIELFSVFYGIAFFPDQFDLNYNDRMHIWVDGGPESIVPADPAQVITWTNPLNNRTYMTTTTPFGDYMPAAAVLQKAQQFSDAYLADPTEANLFAVQNIQITIENIRGTYLLYGHFAF